MANETETMTKLLDEIGRIVDNKVTNTGAAEMVRNLAEAWAWLHSPAQPHGSHAVNKS